MKQLQTVISGNVENTTLQTTVIDVLSKYEGQKITKKHIGLLSEALPAHRVWLRKQYGMVHLEVHESGTEVCPLSLLLCHGENNPLISIEEIKEKNGGYFDAADERNKDRKKALANRQGMQELESAINDYNVAASKIRGFFKQNEEFGTDELNILRECLDKIV